MKFAPSLLFAAGLGLGLVSGHEPHHHGSEEKDIPLHEREFVKDSAEELERKWGFEVSLFLSYLSSGLIVQFFDFIFCWYFADFEDFLAC